jgi:hypothetical protein
LSEIGRTPRAISSYGSRTQEGVLCQDFHANIDVTDVLSLLHPQINLDTDEVSGGYLPSANHPSLKPPTKICDVWDEQPPEERIHVFVGLLHGVGEPTADNTGGECFIRLDDQAQDIQ